MPNSLLVFNCHEAWVHQLSWLPHHLDIITGLRGRHTRGWDDRVRPRPPRSRLLTLAQARESPEEYAGIIAHNMVDLMDIRMRPEPRVLMLHSTIEGRALEEETTLDPEAYRETVKRYLQLFPAHVAAVSPLKGESWGLPHDLVPRCADPDSYPAYTGDNPCGLRICSSISGRRKILMWDFHERAFEGIPVKLVGHNPDLPGVHPSRNWDHLKAMLQSHRFYIHTAHPKLEDGYNMATLEAMAAGMPILGNRHPGSPVEHGISGFLSNDPGDLRDYAHQLLHDRALARRLGKKARETVIDEFGPERFTETFTRIIERAGVKRGWKS